MEAIDDGHRFRLTYLRKHWDSQMHRGDTYFVLDVVRERYLRPCTENLGSPEFSELLEPYTGRVYDANIASAAKTAARQRFGGALRRNDLDQESGDGCRETSRLRAQLGSEVVAPRANFAKDATKDFGRKGKAKVEAPSVDTAD
eukprot:jgi/Tetstr1/429045/TSEL_019010.t1